MTRHLRLKVLHFVSPTCALVRADLRAGKTIASLGGCARTVGVECGSQQQRFASGHKDGWALSVARCFMKFFVSVWLCLNKENVPRFCRDFSVFYSAFWFECDSEFGFIFLNKTKRSEEQVIVWFVDTVR